MSDWQQIETAPRDGTVIDVWLGDCDESDRQFYCDADTRRSPAWGWKNGKFRPCSEFPGTMTVFVQPTHWMPLPQPPEDA